MIINLSQGAIYCRKKYFYFDTSVNSGAAGACFLLLMHGGVMVVERVQALPKDAEETALPASTANLLDALQRLLIQRLLCSTESFLFQVATSAGILRCTVIIAYQ